MSDDLKYRTTFFSAQIYDARLHQIPLPQNYETLTVSQLQKQLPLPEKIIDTNKYIINKQFCSSNQNVENIDTSLDNLNNDIFENSAVEYSCLINTDASLYYSDYVDSPSYNGEFLEYLKSIYPNTLIIDFKTPGDLLLLVLINELYLLNYFTNETYKNLINNIYAIQNQELQNINTSCDIDFTIQHLLLCYARSKNSKYLIMINKIINPTTIIYGNINSLISQASTPQNGDQAALLLLRTYNENMPTFHTLDFYNVNLFCNVTEKSIYEFSSFIYNVTINNTAETVEVPNMFCLTSFNMFIKAYRYCNLKTLNINNRQLNISSDIPHFSKSTQVDKDNVKNLLVNCIKKIKLTDDILTIIYKLEILLKDENIDDNILYHYMYSSNSLILKCISGLILRHILYNKIDIIPELLWLFCKIYYKPNLSYQEDFVNFSFATTEQQLLDVNTSKFLSLDIYYKILHVEVSKYTTELEFFNGINKINLPRFILELLFDVNNTSMLNYFIGFLLYKHDISLGYKKILYDFLQKFKFKIYDKSENTSNVLRMVNTIQDKNINLFEYLLKLLS